MPRLLRLGYFGKTPATGDFLVRNIERDVREALDGWLQQAMEASRKSLGDAWMQSFLTAPIWRFAVTGLSSRGVVVGLLMPSVDKVGRYFPFAVIAELAESKIDARSLMECDSLLSRIEPLLLTALDDDFDLDFFGRQLEGFAKRIGSKSERAGSDAPNIAQITDLAALDGSLANLDWREASVCWTEGSDYRKAEMLFQQGLPKPAVFASLLRDADIFADFEGDWSSVRHLGLMQNDNGQVELGRASSPLPFHAICHPGKTQSHNAGYAELAADGSMLVLSDGRFGVKSHAMVSRLMCRSLPTIWQADDGMLPVEDLERLVGFLASKTPSQSSNLLPMLSFAATVHDPEQDCFHLAIAGDYFCLHYGNGTITKLFATGDSEGMLAPTVRRPAGTLYEMVSVRLAPGERLIVGSSVFSDKLLEPYLTAALAAEDVATVTHALIQEPLIRGLGGNLALAVVQGQGKSSN